MSARLVEGIVAAIAVAALVAGLTFYIIDMPPKQHTHHNSVQYEED